MKPGTPERSFRAPHSEAACQTIQEIQTTAARPARLSANQWNLSKGRVQGSYLESTIPAESGGFK